MPALGRILSFLSDALSGAVLAFVRHYPGRAGTRLRFHYYRRRLGGLGAGTRIDEGVHVSGAEHIFVGSNCWIAAGAMLFAAPTSTEHRELVEQPNASYSGREGELHIADDTYIGPQAYVNAHGGIRIGRNVAVSVGAKLFSVSHYHRSAEGPRGRPTYAGGMARSREDPQALLIGPVVVGDRAFVGAGAIVLPGVTVGRSSWVGAGSLVRADVEPESVYSGR